MKLNCNGNEHTVFIRLLVHGYDNMKCNGSPGMDNASRGDCQQNNYIYSFSSPCSLIKLYLLQLLT